MADAVHVPLIGDVKKPYLIGGVIVTGGIVGIAYWRHQQSIAAANAASTSTDTSTTGSYDPNAIDPSTGETYAAEASGDLGSFPYGGVSDYGGSYYGSGNIVGYDQYGNPIYSTGITGNETYTTNSQWATQAEDDAVTLGIDQSAAATAISKILAGLSVTTNQQDIFLQLVGLDGQPPQGYPQPIKVVDSPGQPSGGTGTTTTTPSGNATVPNVEGKTSTNAVNELKSYGFTVGLNGSGTVVSQTPAGGKVAKRGSRVDLHAEAKK